MRFAEEDAIRSMVFFVCSIPWESFLFVLMKVYTESQQVPTQTNGLEKPDQRESAI